MSERMRACVGLWHSQCGGFGQQRNALDINESRRLAGSLGHPSGYFKLKVGKAIPPPPAGRGDKGKTACMAVPGLPKGQLLQIWLNNWHVTQGRQRQPSRSRRRHNLGTTAAARCQASCGARA